MNINITRPTISKISLYSRYLLPIVLLFPQLVKANVNMSDIYSNDMILQRELAVPISGSASDSENITVTFSGQTKTTTADSSGYWKIYLDPMPADGNGITLQIQGNNTLSYTNVIVGDIWITSGQSNMQVNMGNDASYEGEGVTSLPQMRFKAMNDGWFVASDSVRYRVSTVGWFFGKKIHLETGVPIGLIWAAIGGTPIESWMNEQSIIDDPHLTPGGTFDNKPLSGMYEEHLKRYIPFGVRGAIWYQGERNAKTNWAGGTYTRRLMSMIEGWRTDFESGDFPFYWVQLPTWDEARNCEFHVIREEMRLALQLKNTGMTTNIDIGTYNLHPDRKDLTGGRLGDLALVHHYKVLNQAPMGPMYESSTIEGSTMRLKFRDFGAGIVARNPVTGEPEDVLGFRIAGDRGLFYDATGTIEGNEIIISSPKVSSPTRADYAYEDDVRGNFSIYNTEGLPASPFRTYGPQLPDGVFGCTDPNSPGYDEDATIHDPADCVVTGTAL